jgi:hypothetical protein
MGGVSVFHWLIVLVWIFGIGFPVARILGRLGYSKALAILAFVPLVNIITLGCSHMANGRAWLRTVNN